MLRFVFLVSCFMQLRSGWTYESPCYRLDATLMKLCASCKRGWWGDRCEHTCRSHCDIAGCHQSNGSCLDCDAGYYTESCTTPCPDNCSPSYQEKVFCHRFTGACLEGCRHGWWGDWCKKRCITGCEGGMCSQHYGICIKSCNPGWSGNWCDVPCPALCALAPDGGRYCHWNTRKCQDGCTDGWWGGHCQLECSSNCISKSCYHVNGSCTEGCKVGRTGDRCDVRCPSGCRDGICIQDGNHRCSNGSHDHQLKSTVCTHGCVEGWWSHSCMRKCPDNCEVCGRETGHCHEVEKSVDDTRRPSSALRNGTQPRGITLTNPVWSLLLSIFALLSW